MPHTNRMSRDGPPASDSRETALLSEITTLKSDLRALVAVALQHGLRDYCEDRLPEVVRDLEESTARSEQRVEVKYAKILAAIRKVPGLQATLGETGERTYYRNAIDQVAYLEHALTERRFVLSGIWVVPAYRGKGIAHRLLRRLVEAADEVECGITLQHDPFGEEGLDRAELEAFYNRHGFQQHETAGDGLYRFPCTPLDLYARRR
ncbi:GNAT family N-acetyltransferase [Maritimibacter alkaliphilus]|uniref:GNAT family N-acetyltransferase n=1 Tax=Maritimibacter alkaliphilus TaxID=404236 RepID=UPI001C93EF4C|nr:GNAT family N-acetyltransferase [Maritimibacter alkaliphilus]MBY6092547.1 GNAT family N-acetyltransferase [Maritimibacter alkaliphilus]